jgi:hypothetical protein
VLQAVNFLKSIPLDAKISELLYMVPEWLAELVRGFIEQRIGVGGVALRFHISRERANRLLLSIARRARLYACNDKQRGSLPTPLIPSLSSVTTTTTQPPSFSSPNVATKTTTKSETEQAPPSVVSPPSIDICDVEVQCDLDTATNLPKTPILSSFKRARLSEDASVVHLTQSAYSDTDMGREMAKFLHAARVHAQGKNDVRSTGV